METYIKFLIDNETKEKIKNLKKKGINISQILRNFLTDYLSKQS